MVATPSAVGADEDGLQVLLGQGVGELFPVEDVGDDPSRIDPAGAGGWSSGGEGTVWVCPAAVFVAFRLGLVEVLGYFSGAG
jgi:hypothetical protein